MLRANPPRFDAGEDCRTRKSILDFWRWFYLSPAASRLATQHGFVPLLSSVRTEVLTALESELRCDGRLVHQAQPVQRLSFVGDAALYRVFTLVHFAFEERDSELELAFESMPPGKAVATAADGLLVAGSAGHAVAVVPRYSVSARESDLLTLSVAGVGVTLIFSLCGVHTTCHIENHLLVLDLALITALVNGKVTTWGDDRLAALDPWMRESTASALLASAPMRIYAEEAGSPTMMQLGAKLCARGHQPSFAA